MSVVLLIASSAVGVRLWLLFCLVLFGLVVAGCRLFVYVLAVVGSSCCFVGCRLALVVVGCCLMFVSCVVC